MSAVAGRGSSGQIASRVVLGCYLELLDETSGFSVEGLNIRRTIEDRRRQNINMPPAIAPSTESKGMTASGPTYSIITSE